MKKVGFISHKKQLDSSSCGAYCFSMITGKSIEESRQLCKTKKSGTYIDNIYLAFQKEGYYPKQIKVNNDWNYLKTHLRLLSNQYPVIVSGNFINQGKRGRSSNRHHCFIIQNEKIYDSGELFDIDIDCNNHLFNKKLEIKSIILVNFNEATEFA
ncbi:MAG: cysteine peptidase family C39 domain-containing protein [Nanoarchaeota archaeon]